MKKIFIFSLLLSVWGCENADLQPIPFSKLEVGSMITLRGTAFNYLLNESLLGEVGTFSVAMPAASQKIEFDVEYIAKDKATLSKIEVYALANGKGTRSKVTTIDGAMIKMPSDPKIGRYPQGKISLPLADVLKAMNKTLADFPAESNIQIQCDLVLTSGKTVPASSIANSSLFETTWFYPAHKLTFLAL